LFPVSPVCPPPIGGQTAETGIIEVLDKVSFGGFFGIRGELKLKFKLTSNKKKWSDKFKYQHVF
jgi:hypothetical protein